MQGADARSSPLRASGEAREVSEDPLETLRTITRHMATADDLETVLNSIIAALVEGADAAMARIFLLMYDHECPICRQRIDAGQQRATDERALHLVASDGKYSGPDGLFHRVSLDSTLPTAVLMRLPGPVLIPDWRAQDGPKVDPRI